MDFVIRNQPLFSVSLKEDCFVVIDKKRENQSGTYSYDRLIAVHFKNKKVNALTTALAVLLDLFTSHSSSKVYRDKAILTIKLREKQIQIHGLDLNRNKAELLNSKLGKHIV